MKILYLNICWKGRPWYLFMKVYFVWSYCLRWGFPGDTMGLPRWYNGKESTTKARDAVDKEQVQSRGSGRSPGVGNGNPLQYSCLENSMDRGIWQVTVFGVAKSWIWLSMCTYTAAKLQPFFTCLCCYSKNMKLRPVYLDSVLDDNTVNQNITSYLNIFLKKTWHVNCQ